MRKLFIVLLSFFCFHFTQAQFDLWGMAYASGQWNGGGIFKSNAGLNPTCEYAFKRVPTGRPVGKMVQASDGKLYGISSNGGTVSNSFGTIYKYDPATGEYTFLSNLIGTMGRQPYGSLIEASNGKLYGLNSSGGMGSGNSGTLFEYNYITNTYTVKFDFNGLTQGAVPYGSLLEVAPGKLYGMTSSGGANNMGTIFMYDLAMGTCTTLVNFSGVANGANPKGSLMLASDGFVYGMTTMGGTNNKGTLFQFNTVTNTLVKKIDFQTFNGELPSYSSLSEDVPGKLFGMTERGGSAGFGEIFSYNLSTSSLTTLYSFFSNGRYPTGDLFKASDGMLYAMTSLGGTNSKGTIFKFDPVNNIFTHLFDFNGKMNGANPYGSFIEMSPGKLFSVTYDGGVSLGQGVLFEYNFSTSTYTKKHDCNGANDGYAPYGSLATAPNGRLYGMTKYGGMYGFGVLFEYDPGTHVYTKKIDLDSITSGSYPEGSLFLANNGKFYGMTYNGGLNNYGVLFEYDYVTNTVVKKYDFNLSNGIRPYGNLMQASNGKLYGMTSGGGFGKIFEYNIATSTYSVIVNLGGSLGSFPYGSLIQATDGYLYGMTNSGGSFGWGTLFQLDISTNTYVKKVDFTNTGNGSIPRGTLFQAANGKIYGMTGAGGSANVGTVFIYDISTSVLTKKFDMVSIGSTGTNPYGQFMQASDGMLYATTSDVNLIPYSGRIFKYNTATDAYSVTSAFSPSVAYQPHYVTLIEIPVSVGTASVAASYCAGGFLTVPFAAVGTFSPGNVFSVELSDAVGSFASPVVIGSLTSINNTPINCIIPPGTPAGTGYRVRVTSTMPALTGPNNGSNITITNGALPSITVNNGTICAGTNFTMVPSGATSYTYPGGGPIVNPMTTTVFTVSGTGTTGCTSFGTSTVTVNPAPSITANSGTMCAGSSYTIIPSGATTYSIQGGSAVVSPTVTTLYLIAGTSSLGCVSLTSGTCNVQVYALPTVSIYPSPSVSCAGQNVFLSAGGSASTFTWSTGSTASFIMVTPTVTTTYTLNGTDGNGCKANQNVYTHSVSPCTGIPVVNTNENSISVQPNPFHDKFTVTCKEKQELQIFNVLGELIYKTITEAEKTEIDLSLQPHGIYFVRIGNYTGKVVKE